MTILQGLVGCFDRVAETGAVAPLGYSTEKISFCLVLDPQGGRPDVQDLRDHSGKRPQPRPLLVPQPVKRTSGVAANFLWDKTAYVFGRSANSKRAADEHAAFRALHEDLLRGTNDEGLLTLLAFLRDWDPSSYEALPCAAEMLDQNVVFRLRAKSLDDDPEFLHERPAARGIWERHRAGLDAARATCLVTGEIGPVARLHPAIKGVPGAQSSGASLVSFNLDAFTSYGKEQGANAPVSERAAHAYAAALNMLLAASGGLDPKGRPKWTNRVQIGDATTVFWAEAEGGPDGIAKARRAEELVLTVLDPPTDEAETGTLRAVLRDIEQGRPQSDLPLDLDPRTVFYVLGLSPNAARLSVRFFLETTLGALYSNARQHFLDLTIEPPAWRTPPALWRLLRETAAQREADNVSPALAGELARAVFTGGRYPRALLALTLMRIRADGDVNGLRAAILKACLVRDHRKGFEQEDVPVTLDPRETNTGYRLGRLFAILERAQYAALGDVNATIRDKYFSSASANPARVFPLLLRGAQDHLGKVRAKGSGGLAHWFDTAIADVMSGLPASEPFPRTLRLEDQGRFAVGYYHQRQAAKPAARDAEGTPETNEEET